MSSLGTLEAGPSAPAQGIAEDRIHALDALRAVAMFLGIVLHAAVVYAEGLPMEGVGTDVSSHWSFGILLGAIHGFRMHLFFFLSGFFARLVREKLGTKGFAKQRLKRIGIPFAIGMVTLMPMVIALAVWGFARAGQELPQPPGSERGLAAIPTMHLWFLLYLLYLYAGALIVLAIGKWMPGGIVAAMDRTFCTVIRTPWRVIAFAPLTVICLWIGPYWGEPILPIFSMIPEPWTLAHYAVFFAVGWWMHRQRRELPELKRFAGSGLLVALMAFVMWGVFLELEKAGLIAVDRNVAKTACLFCAAIYAWAMTFCMTGLFLRFAHRESARMRYMADASYWCYLAHLPVVMFLQIIAAQWRWPALLKFALVLGVTMALLLASYEWMVRYRWIGALLNGKRTRAKA